MSIKITTLMDNTARQNTSLASEHGLSLFIEGNNFNILFDTGQTAKFLDNASKLGIDLSKTTHVIMSHAHYDHTGGFRDFVHTLQNPVDLYISKFFFREKHAFEKELYRYIGPNFNKSFLDNPYIRTHYVDESMVDIGPGIFLATHFQTMNTYETIPSKFYIKENDQYVKDDFRDEIVLVIEVQQGLIVILGCSHPGVVNILETLVQRKNKPIFAIMGGTHLNAATPSRLQYTFDYFKKQNIQHIGVSHCTGETAMQELEKRFSGYFHNCAGTRIIINNTFYVK